MKRNCGCFERLSFNGVVLHSIKHLPEEARAVRFVMALMQSVGVPAGAQTESCALAEHLKRTWRRGKKRIFPQATKLRVETLTRTGEEFALVVLIIRFKNRPHSTHQDQIVGVCGTPHGYLWRARKLGGSEAIT